MGAAEATTPEGLLRSMLSLRDLEVSEVLGHPSGTLGKAISWSVSGDMKTVLPLTPHPPLSPLVGDGHMGTLEVSPLPHPSSPFLGSCLSELPRVGLRPAAQPGLTPQLDLLNQKQLFRKILGRFLCP